MLRRSLTTLCFGMLLAAPASALAATITGPGGASAQAPPDVIGAECRSQCTDEMARPGSKVVLAGTGLRYVASVRFTGGATAVPGSAKDARVVVSVPAGARTGPVTVTDDEGREAVSPTLGVLAVKAPPRTSAPIAVAVSRRKAFVDGGARRPTLSYRLQTSAPADVTVSVVNRRKHAVVATLDQGTVAPGEVGAATWTGRAGRYAFVVAAANADGVRATTSQAKAQTSFVLLGHRFPIRGKHAYGMDAGRFGAGRAGHSHQGQDVFAACGTPLVAARGGRVKIAKYQGNAGNYLVIDDAGEGTDTMYAHLRDPALIAKGERVHTGDPIGFVGDTGDAQGCHLHFEEWDAPGWYTGGSPFDPLADLKAWDADS